MESHEDGRNIRSLRYFHISNLISSNGSGSQIASKSMTKGSGAWPGICSKTKDPEHGQGFVARTRIRSMTKDPEYGQ